MLEKQRIVTYRGANIDAQFRRHAATMAMEGWSVQNATYGGMRRAGCLSFLTLGLMGGRKPKDLTVIYTRP